MFLCPTEQKLKKEQHALERGGSSAVGSTGLGCASVFDQPECNEELPDTRGCKLRGGEPGGFFHCINVGSEQQQGIYRCNGPIEPACSMGLGCGSLEQLPHGSALDL